MIKRLPCLYFFSVRSLQGFVRQNSSRIMHCLLKIFVGCLLLDAKLYLAPVGHFGYYRSIFILFKKQLNIPDTSDPPIPGITSPMYSGNSLTHLFRESSDPGIPGMV